MHRDRRPREQCDRTQYSQSPRPCQSLSCQRRAPTEIWTLRVPLQAPTMEVGPGTGGGLYAARNPIGRSGLKNWGTALLRGALSRGNRMKKMVVLWVCLSLGACLGMPEKVSPVDGFQVDRYLGKWYEIARLDHSFERGLENVTAEYTRRDDGGIAVMNRGFSPREGQWNAVEGKAYFVNSPTEGYLKVSFFGPFYGSYVIFELDKEQYQYAFVSGPDLSYLWLLSRTPVVSSKLLIEFKEKSRALGFDTSNLIIVDHDHENSGN